MPSSSSSSFALGLGLVAACGSVADPAIPDGGPPRRPDAGPATAGPGHVTFTLGGDVVRVEARAGAVPENVSAALADAPREPDRRLDLSPDGAWYVLETGNLASGCPTCLAIAPVDDPAAATLVRPGGELVSAAESRSAVASGGGLVVYAAAGGPHARDLFATERTADGWSAPRLLTGASPYAWNELPAIDPSGTRLLFDCGPEANAAGAGASICEVGTDGGAVEVRFTPDDAPAWVERRGPLHHADWAPDGSVVFEADWDGERIWRGSPDGVTPVTGLTDSNDNAPCVLPDGRIASLYLGRPGNERGWPELKLMGPGGDGAEVIGLDQDAAELELGCGE